MASPNYTANGTIAVSTFVKIDGSTPADFKVLQAGTADKIVGVSQTGPHDAPGITGSTANAAVAGQVVKVYGVGDECLVTAGAAITAGDMLKSNASGQAITSPLNESGTVYIGGFALEGATGSGVLIRMIVLPFVIAPTGVSSNPTFATVTMTGLFYESATNGITAHAGGGQGSATALTTEVNRVTTVATSGDSVLLPVTTTPGLTIFVINKGAKPLAVFPQTGDAIDGLSANSSVTQMVGSMVLYTSTVSGQWDSEGIGTGYNGSIQTLNFTDAITAHAGGGQGSATALTTAINRVTTVATAGDSVVLPTSAAGMQITVTNAAANTADVFPASGDVINGLAANIAVPLPFGTVMQFDCTVAGTWMVTIQPQIQRTLSAPTNATATMSSGVLSDLTFRLPSGLKFNAVFVLNAKNSTAGEGLQFDLNGGTATFTSINFGFVGTPAGGTVGVVTSTAIGTALTVTTVSTSDAYYTIAVSGVVNAGGTLIPRFAEVSHSTGTATVEINSSGNVYATTA